ncbi:energy-coupling factor transport system substrate-specific component [Eubacterium ruminantium]|nr:energy-coupling factor transport system substrate-specific component [Eubacterium ruminantium]
MKEKFCRIKPSGRRKQSRTRLVCFTLAAFIIFGILGIYPGKSFAETISGGENEEINVDPTNRGVGYSAVLYDNTNGLPTSEANAIAQTSEGFIWIGSYSGLIRYDGNKFERIDSTSGITSVVTLYVDSKDRLWIGTNDNGVAVMERGEYTRYGVEDGMSSSSIRSIVEDKEGDIYIATTHGVYIVDKDMKLSLLDESQLNDEYICELRLSSNNVIYGETMDGAVFMIENKHVSGFFEGKKIGINDIYTILPDDNNPDYVYIGTESKSIYYGNLRNGMSDMKAIDISPLTQVNSMERFSSQIWICATNGIGILEDGELTVLSNIPMNNSIGHMLVDYQGNLWFTSSRQGVMKIVANQFTDIFEWYNIPSKVVNATAVYDNMLFVGMDSGLIVISQDDIVSDIPIKKIDTTSDKLKDFKNLQEFFSGVRIRSMYKDSDGHLWIATYSDRGLVEYHDGELKVYRKDDGLPSDKVRVVYERKDKVKMVSCSGGMALLKDGKIEEVYDEGSGLSNQEVLTAVEADNGDMILGTDGGGIFVIKGGKVENFGREDGLESEVVMRIKKDDKRKLFWIITSNSIAYMTEDYKITTVDKFPYSNNFDLYENSIGEMWILSSNGIYVTTADELIANGDIRTVFYNRDNGLKIVSTANSYSDITEEGVLYISGTTGVVKVNIEKPFEDVGNLKMAVPYVEGDGKTYYPDSEGEFIIPSSVKRLTIYSYVYSYSLLNPVVTYSLEGFEGKERSVERTKLEPVDYTNLDGGRYYFKMKLQDSMGHGNNELSVLIIKKKSVYERAWFKALCVIAGLLVLAAIVFLYVRKKTKALLKKQEEHKLFVKEMTEAFAKTIDIKDKYTNGHSTRVAEYTAMLTRELGYDEEMVEKYYNIALLHDIGKIAIPPEVLNKPGKLTDEEFKIIKSHSMQGYRVLKDISIMPELAIGAGAHHERPDGKGYPRGLKGDEIPRVAQIIAVADTFDAMYSDRPYRKRMNFEKAVSIIKEVSGTQLFSDVVDAFLRLVEKGEFRDPEDDGGGTTEDINNIHKKFENDDKAEKKES